MANERQHAEYGAAKWIARRDTGPWSEADAAAFAAWLEESAGNRVAYYRLNGAWQEAGRLKALVGSTVPASELSSPSTHGLIDGSPPQRTALRAPLFRFSLAATVLFAVGVALLSLQSDFFQRERYSTVVGGLQVISLPDGSRVTLNTDSLLHIAFTESVRRAELDRGEAFFEVAKNPNRPFIVSAGDQRIVAVGTAFAVRRQADSIRVVVSEGKVRVEIPGQEAALRQPLPAGSIVRTEHDDLLVQTKPIAEIEQSLSWRSGILTFRDTPLADAVAEFNRYNIRKIVIDDPAVAALQIGGIFRAKNLDPFVSLLEDGFPVRAVVEKDRIVLTSR